MTYPQMIETQMQVDRLARAQLALRSGEMSVLPLVDQNWSITSKGNCYTVARQGQAWTCTCPDFSGRCQRFGLLCKHIAAVQLIQIEQNFVRSQSDTQTKPLTRTSDTEDFMPQTAPMIVQTSPDTALAWPTARSDRAPAQANQDILNRLRQPLDMNRVKRRQAPGMGSVPYLEGYDVIEAANDLFQFRWSFDLLGEPKIMRWDRAVMMYDTRARKKVPLLAEDGKPATEVSGIAYITGRISIELDGIAYTHADVGRCIFSGDSPEALDMALAGAATDCLKRCFRQLGEQFGNSLYDKDVARTAGTAVPASMDSGSPVETAAHPSPKEAHPHPAAPASPAAETQSEPLRYQDGTAVEQINEAELNAFKAFKAAHQNQAPTTREVLRAWTSKNTSKKQ